MDLVYFILLISTLIFIHESGHFAFAKLFGVKVLEFSIGFGPRVVRIHGRETEYSVALLPFGGFVKLLEASKQGEDLLPEERHRTFEAQPLWKRLAIVLAGPAMNLIFPIVLYSSVFAQEKDLLPAVVGIVQPGMPADGKLLPGDKILEVSGNAVSSFLDVQRVVASNIGRALRFSVERAGRPFEIPLVPLDQPEPHELDITEHEGRIGISPHFPAASIGVVHGSPAYTAGLRTFDMITAVNGHPVRRFVDLVMLLSENRGTNSQVSFLRPVRVSGGRNDVCDVAFYEPQIKMLAPDARGFEGATAGDDILARQADVLTRAGIESSDLYVSFVPPGSSEALAELRPGDRILTLDGAEERLWASMEARLLRGADRVHRISFLRGGEVKEAAFQIRKEQWDDEIGQPHELYVFRTDHFAPNAPDMMVANPSPIIDGIRRGFAETESVIRLISVGFIRLLQGRISLDAFSGPITMYDIAGQAGARGATHFVWAMAVISVNLGLLNLAPIPVLDGGQIVFLAFEALLRRPVSLRVREVASLIGVILLVVIMLIAFKNDVAKRWDIVSDIREIFT